MLDLNRNAEDQTNRLRMMNRVANETQNTSNNIMRELGEQKDKIVNANNMVRLANAERRDQRADPGRRQEDQGNDAKECLHKVRTVRGDHRAVRSSRSLADLQVHKPVMPIFIKCSAPSSRRARRTSPSPSQCRTSTTRRSSSCPPTSRRPSWNCRCSCSSWRPTTWSWCSSSTRCTAYAFPHPDRHRVLHQRGSQEGQPLSKETHLPPHTPLHT